MPAANGDPCRPRFSVAKPKISKADEPIPTHHPNSFNDSLTKNESVVHIYFFHKSTLPSRRNPESSGYLIPPFGCLISCRDSFAHFSAPIPYFDQKILSQRLNDLDALLSQDGEIMIVRCPLPTLSSQPALNLICR